MKKETIGILLVIIMNLTTFWFSSKPAIESRKQSDEILIELKIISQNDTVKFIKTNHITTHIIRKTAHFTLYFIEGVGMFLATGGNIFKSIFILFLMAGIDETHQYFVPGRGSQFSDVLLDTLGGSIAIIILKLITIFTKKKAIN